MEGSLVNLIVLGCIVYEFLHVRSVLMPKE